MSRRRNWESEQTAAEQAQLAARKHLMDTGMRVKLADGKVVGADPSEAISSMDNTLELVRERKVKEMLLKTKAEVPEPFRQPSQTLHKVIGAVPVEKPLPSGWACIVVKGLKTYVHKASGCVTTRRPPSTGTLDKAESTGINLPRPWKCLFDEGSERLYYWNPETEEVQWEPAEAEVPPEVSQEPHPEGLVAAQVPEPKRAQESQGVDVQVKIERNSEIENSEVADKQQAGLTFTGIKIGKKRRGITRAT